MKGYTTLELIVVCAVVTLLVLCAVVPAYVRYAHAREVSDAAALLAQDIAYLERFAENSETAEGATIEVTSDDPLAYVCESGRPSELDPQSHIRAVLFARSFPKVALIPGPLRHGTPFLFAHNGSIQYVTAHEWADQHVAIAIGLRSLEDAQRTAEVDVDPFSGAASTR